MFSVDVMFNFEDDLSVADNFQLTYYDCEWEYACTSDGCSCFNLLGPVSGITKNLKSQRCYGKKMSLGDDGCNLRKYGENW